MKLSVIFPLVFLCYVLVFAQNEPPMESFHVELSLGVVFQGICLLRLDFLTQK